MDLPLEISALALSDLDELFRFIHRRSGASAAGRWRTRLFNRLADLSHSSEVWPLSEGKGLAELGIREFLVHHWRHVYRVFYTTEKNRVLIHRIRSAAQDELTVEDF
jgi:plasmid stabilization system protein ParE